MKMTPVEKIQRPDESDAALRDAAGQPAWEIEITGGPLFDLYLAAELVRPWITQPEEM